MITIFILINSFTSFFFFFFKKLDNFVCFITPVLEKWLIEMKRLVASHAVVVLSVPYG